MNAIDFGHAHERAFNRGICMWAKDMEWCARPVVVEDYRGNFHEPDRYRFGALYGIHVEGGIPEHDSMWICDTHRMDFINLNVQPERKARVFQFDRNGMGTEVHLPNDKYWVNLKIEVPNGMMEDRVMRMVKGIIDNGMRNYPDLQAWREVTIAPVDSREG